MCSSAVYIIIHVCKKWLLLFSGFEGVYQRRTGANVDGCAVFYCAKTFRLLEWKGVCYQRSLKVLDRDNVGIVAKLAVRKHPKWSVVIPFTHQLLLFICTTSL